MKTSTTKKEYAFKEAATLVTGAIFTLAALLFTACPNNAGGGGTPIISYVPVSYDKLEEYLTNQTSGSRINYIELTGSIPPADLKGSPSDASSLGQKLAAAAPKKIGLKLPASAASVTDMSGCFTGCTNLVNVASLPRDLTDMSNCFKGCTALETLDAVPANVTNMQHCFDGCTNLKSVTLKCAYNPAPIGGNTAFFAAFKNCTALKARSITVPYGTLGAYTDSTACAQMAVQADRFVEAAADFVQVDYASLDTHLTHNLTVGVNCIEITGTIPFGDLTGTSSDASPLGQKLKDKSPKQFVLKLPANIAGLTDMSYCFNGCNNVVSLATIPESVTDMTGCFSGCAALTQAPVIPDGVTDLTDCFKGCARLTRVSVIPQGVTKMENCFNGCTALTGAALKCNYNAGHFTNAFSGCNGLTAGSIRVKPPQLTDYQNNAVAMGTQHNRFVGDNDLLFNTVPYDKLDEYLTNTASATDINYIELTGTIPPADLKGEPVQRSKLCATLNKHENKKVALKLPESIAGLSDMSYCFDSCKGLVSLKAIPQGVTNMRDCFITCENLTAAPVIPQGVTNMQGCFAVCKNLTAAPVIPQGVTNMESCFTFCEKLTAAPVIPEGVTNMLQCFYNCTNLTEPLVIPKSVTCIYSCFLKCKLTGVTLKCNYIHGKFSNAFDDCLTLTPGSIKVPADQLKIYKDHAVAMGVTSDKFAAE